MLMAQNLIPSILFFLCLITTEASAMKIALACESSNAGTDEERLVNTTLLLDAMKENREERLAGRAQHGSGRSSAA